MRRALLFCCCALALLICAGLAEAQKAPLTKLDEGLQAVAAGTDIPLSYRPIPQHLLAADAAMGRTRPAPAEYVRPSEFSAIFEFDGSRAALEAAGIRVNSQVGNIFTASVRPEEVQNLALVSGIRNAQLSRYVELHLDRSVPDVRGDLVHGTPSGSPPVYPGTTGKGMILGDVDTGIDFSRPDFKDPVTGLTRVLYIWDQTGSGSPPSGFSYGREWTGAQIDGGSCTETDTNGHGTWVAGVLVGNGATTGCSVPAYHYVGMAPEANFIEVKSDLTNAHIIDGVNYVFQKAAALGKDAVVNLSLGSEFGPHDGSDTFGKAISALTGPGKIVVASAGNNQDTNLHGMLVTTSTTPGTDKFTFNVPTYTANSGAGNDFFVVTGWYDPSVSLSLKVKGPTATDTSSVGYGSSRGRSTSGGYIYLANMISTYPGTTTKRQFECEVYDGVAGSPPRVGTWELDINTNGTSPTGKRVDIWIYSTQLGAAGAIATVVNGLNLNNNVGTPGDADSVFCVGAHTTKAQWWACVEGGYCHYTINPPVNDIAEFSNHGPRIDGLQKPEITAPGFGVASTHSTSSAAISTCGDDSDGVHQVVSGTSFSSPHVAAAVALYLQHVGHLPPSRVKAIFEAATRRDAFVGAVPNNTWGWGKLDVWSAFDHVAPSVAVTAPVGGENWVVGTSYNVTWTATDANGVDSVALDYSVDNGAHWIPVAANLTNSGTYSWPVPPPSTTQALVRVTAIDVFQNRGSGQSPSTFNIRTPVPVQLSEVVAAPEHGYVDVSWSAFFDTAPRFQVFRSTARAGTYEAVSGVLDGVGKHEFSFRDRTATQPATEYFYKVGYSETGAWVYSSPIRVVTPAAVF
ncbi:MAG TPA: S8 family serine peptidase, partial [Candidatus Saccharimonadales bacterium]|nr:S8 family serine peptidase [Candidatus Saccharimonadales bacterium]